LATALPSMIVAMNGPRDFCGNYIETNYTVKNYLKHLDDMENWKGQQQAPRFPLGIVKRSFDLVTRLRYRGANSTI